ncbi:hypothetical protein [Bacillus clarus]|uniref:Uncharacterized protein n=1 Tax=Bacillus clarus TaxID=2338372 RepID=A0A090Y9J2_9BACI|nr:hypothetical protein [Bacillus clarus]KFM95109.1 hypothetical protein DJ93_5622 [Bacillus clarus]
MQSKEEMIAFSLTAGLIIPAVALCGEDHEEEKGHVISDLPFEY